MRFHMGVSFSWRTIKKFLFPILIGILAYFGFNFIYDSNTPLGFIKVNALENEEIIEEDSIEEDSIEDNYNYWVNALNLNESIDEVEHKALFNKIYWFDDNSSEYGVLCSIYELLLLYCFTMIGFKFLTFIKNTRW